MSVLAGQLSDGGIAHMPTCAVATFTWDEDDWDVVDSLDPRLDLDALAAPRFAVRLVTVTAYAGAVER